MSRATAKTGVYRELPVSVYGKFLPEGSRDEFIEMMLLFRDYGYYGADTEKEVSWTAKQARSKLTTLEEYLEKNPLKLE